jgi:hypothetical protein
MTLINTDGMSFIGPGSEWFWTALTGIVLAITFIALYRQFRLQAHATAVEQVQWFQREGLGSELTQRLWLEVLVALRDRKDPADLPEYAAVATAEFWENFASLARTGHRDPKLYWRIDGRSAQIVWAMFAPWVHKRRAEFGSPDFLADLEWLAGLMTKMDGRKGRPAFTPASIPRFIDSGIKFGEAKLRVLQAMKTVTLAQPAEAETVAQPTVAAPPAE